MCGFVGLLGNGSDDKKALCEMIDTINHRGPDSKDYWIDKSSNVSFGHTRLAIQDVTDKGAQPMHSKSERYVIIFNGEIYNNHELRKITKNKYWNGTSDTETLLALIDEYGLVKSLSFLKGMFAFALWDKKSKLLYLTRDKIGEKPLYYGWQNNTFFFGSELKALKKHPLFLSSISKKAVSSFFRYSYIPFPLSIYNGILKLKPGTVLTVNPVNKEVKGSTYWQIENAVLTSETNSDLNEEAMINELDRLLNNSVNLQQISDVPVGAFLSGGIDSSLISAIMQKNNVNKIKTFTVSLSDKEFDESSNARKVADHINSDHNEINIEAKDVINLIPKISQIYDEPFADSSQIPTYLISNFASQSVKVCLSGDGGDELFGGYNRYIFSDKLLNMSKFNKFLVSSSLKALSVTNLEKLYNLLNRFIPGSYHLAIPSEKFEKMKKTIDLKSFKSIYKQLSLTSKDSKNFIINDDYYDHIEDKWIINSKISEDEISCMMFTDINTYLTDDILCKIDRAAMSNSLETRVPFLDTSILEFALNLKKSLKIRNGQGKYILRKVLDKYLPGDDLNSVKQGFSIPISTWLRNELNDWATDLLSKEKIEKYDMLDYAAISSKWDNFVAGKTNNHTEIWNILVFQSWLESQNNL